MEGVARRVVVRAVSFDEIVDHYQSFARLLSAVFGLVQTLVHISKRGITLATMRAAVFVEKNRIVLEDKPVPEVGPLDALIRITVCCVRLVDYPVLVFIPAICAFPWTPLPAFDRIGAGECVWNPTCLPGLNALRRNASKPNLSRVYSCGAVAQRQLER
jgi:hypothetical protein